MAPKDNNEQIELQQHYTYNSNNSNNNNKRRKRMMINNNSNKNDDEGTRRISIAEAEEANKAKAAAAEAAAADHFGTNLRKQVAKLAGQAAKKRLNDIQRSSQLTTLKRIQKEEEEKNTNNTQLSWDDIFVEDMLGMGSFASVCLVTCPKLRRKQQQKEEELMNNNDNRTSATDDYSLSGSMMSYSNLMSYASGSGASTCSEDYSTLDPMKYYACKSLSNKTVHHTNVRGFISAAADLIHESFLLSNLSQHPNIVRLYGKPKDSDIENAFQNNGEDDLGYFLIMEALTGGVLNEKISHWYHSKQIQKTQYKRRRSSLTLTTTAQHSHSHSSQQQQDYAASLSSFLGSQQKQNQQQQQPQNQDQYQRVAPQRTSSAISALSQNSRSNSYTNTRTRRNNNIPLLQERLDIALQIATGMIHLHNNHIIFRDLKPHNVGLSSRPSDSSSDTNSDGVIENKLTWRLFDFGLAREVPSSNRFGSTTGCGSSSGNTRLDGVVHGKSGSLRYMAPETMGGKWLRRTTTTTDGGGPTSITNSKRPRNNNDNNDVGCFATYGSDVFGFAIVLWELVSLEDFDHQYDTNPMKFEEAVCDYNHRPNINVITNELINDYDGDCNSNSNTGGTGTNTGTKTEMIGVILRNLIESCWDEDYKNRPSFESIIIKLHEIISLLSSHSSMKKQISRRSSISRHGRSSLRSSDDHGTTTANNNNNNSNIGINSSDDRIMNNIQFNNSMVLQDPEQNNNAHKNNTAAHFDNDNSKKDDKIDQDDIESDNYENGDDGDDIDLEQQSISIMNGSLLSLMNESFKSMGTSNCDGGASASNTAATNFSSRTCDLIGGGSSSGKVGGAFLSYDDDDNDDDDGEDGEEDEDDEEEYDDAIDESMGMDNDYSSSNITTTSWNNGRLLSDGATTMSISRLSVGGSTSFSNFSFSSFKNNIGGTASTTNRGSDEDGDDGDGVSSLKKYLASTNNNDSSSSKAAAITANFGSSCSLSL